MIQKQTKIFLRLGPLSHSHENAGIKAELQPVYLDLHAAAVTTTITITTQKKNPRVVLVELLHAEYAHAHSANQGRAFVSFSFSLSRPAF